MASSHLIHKVVLDYAFTGKASGAEKLAVAARESFYTEVLPAIERALEEAGITGPVVIDKLELTIGSTELTQLPYLVAARLRSALQQIEPRSVAQTLAVQQQAKAEALLFFLERGYYPPHFDGVAMADLLQQLLIADPFYWQKMVDVLAANLLAQQRFIAQATKVQLAALTTFLIAASVIRTALIAWQKASAIARKSSAFTTHTLLSFLLSQHRQKATADVVNRFMQQVVWPGVQLSTGELLLVEKKLLQEVERADEQAIEAVFEALLINQPGKVVLQPVLTDDLTDDNTPPGEGNLIPHESIATSTAGLVLLHPFLLPFFAELKLLEGASFISPAAQRRAVQVLYYLATGSTKTPEHLLPLAKLLCGLPVHQPVLKTLRITAAEKELCATLLNSVLHHWKPLSGTSIGGLQTSFLQRAGLLKVQGADWVLYVEEKPYDILLPDLPWQYSFIQAPWAPYFIHVQW